MPKPYAVSTVKKPKAKTHRSPQAAMKTGGRQRWAKRARHNRKTRSMGRKIGERAY